MLSIELRYTSFAEWGYGISDYYSYDAEKQNTGERGSGREGGVQMSGHLSVVSYMIINDQGCH